QVDQPRCHGSVTKSAGRPIQNAGSGLAQNSDSENIQLHQVLTIKNAGSGLAQCRGNCRIQITHFRRAVALSDEVETGSQHRLKGRMRWIDTSVDEGHRYPSAGKTGPALRIPMA